MVPRDDARLHRIGRHRRALTFITLSAVGFFLLDRKDGAAALLAVAVLGGVVLNNVLKIGFRAARPEFAAYEPLLSSADFPSGHSTMAAVVYLTIGALIARLHPEPRIRSSSLCQCW